MAFYNSYHSICEYIKQGKGRLLLDDQRLAKAQKELERGKKSRLLQLRELAETHGVEVAVRPSHSLQGLLEQSHYRGFILEVGEAAVATGSKRLADILRERPQLVVLLDGVLDVGNLGALLRSCDLFEVGAVFIPLHGTAGQGESGNQLARASAGALAWVPLIEGNLQQALSQLKDVGYWAYSADMEGDSLFSAEIQFPAALILGAEERGVSHQLLKNSDYSLRIPTAGHLDSLNVSVAGAVCLYEMRRQLSSK